MILTGDTVYFISNTLLFLHVWLPSTLLFVFIATDALVSIVHLLILAWGLMCNKCSLEWINAEVIQLYYILQCC